ncbi:MAG: hypothetical protein J1F65_06085 [Clostridiales bacterium]|nr:hypothetical protein [Clostridiales bacterium]
MPKTKSTLYKVSLALLAVILCASVIAAVCLTTTTAEAYTGSELNKLTSYNIYNSSTKSFTASELKKLFTALGSTDGTYAGLPVATAQGQSVAGKSIIVELGGKKWIAVYYSKADQATANNAKSIAPAKGKADDGDKVLTLWLANTSTGKYTWNQYYDTGTNTGSHTGTDTDYPSNNYGISFMRASVLNNGGDYYSPAANGQNATATSNHGYITPENNKANTEFYDFTTDNIGLMSYLVAPRYMKWQYDGQQARNLRATSNNSQWWDGILNNDAWGLGGSYSDSNGAYNWINKPGYTAWIDDLVWLPSLPETGMDHSDGRTFVGLWGTSKIQNSFDNTAADWSWLRSSVYNSHRACVLGAGGVGSGLDVSGTYAVRPALHLNLSSAAEAAGLTHSKHDLKWVDDGNGNHYQQCTGCEYKSQSTPHTIQYGVSLDAQNKHKGFCTVCHLEITEDHKPTGNITDEGNHDHDGHWTTCSVCGDKVGYVKHTWSGSWAQADDYHYKLCDQCGEIYKEDHTVKTWTKQPDNANHKGSCETCSKEFTQPHDLVWQQNEEGKFYQKCSDCDYQTDPQGSSGDVHEHTWSQEWAVDESHHWHECEDLSCTARNDVDDHQLDDWVAVDGEHYRECKTCHHKAREESHYLTKHEAEPATCKQTGIKEYWECLVCSKFFSDEAGENEISDLNNWKQIPETSGGGQLGIDSSAHVWGSWTDAGNGKHERQCTLCEATESGDHNLTHIVYLDTAKHGGYCEECQLYVEETHTATGDYADADKHDQNSHWKICQVCNGKVNEVAHEFTEETWSASGGKHWKGQCNICNQRFFEDTHQLTKIDATEPTCVQDGHKDYWQCDVCQKYFSNQEGTSEISNLTNWLNNAGNVARTGNEHEWDDIWHYDGDGGHYHECVHNSAHRSSLQHHNYNDKYYDDGGNNHYQVCEDCSYETDHANHSVTAWSSNGSESHTGTCGICHLTLTVNHDWEQTKSFDNNGHWYNCKFHGQGCTAKKDYAEHKVTTWNSADDDNHRGNCVDCDKTAITAAHSIQWNEDSSNKHYKTCTVCSNYESNHEDHVVTRWVDSGDGSNHIGYCSVCGSEEATAGHNWDTENLKYDLSGHWYECKDCKAKRSDDAVTHEWNKLEWKVADGKHYKECAICHQKYEHNAHAKETIAQVDPTCKATGTKAYYHCAVCDKYFSDEACEKLIDLDSWKNQSGDNGGLIPVDSTAHVWGEWQLDSGKGEHYRECTVCQTEDGASRAKHTVTIATFVDNDGHQGYCTECKLPVKVEHTLNTDYKAEGNHDLNSHWQTCTVCNGKANEVTHEWSGSWTNAGDDHTKTCGDCGQVKREAHSVTSWTNADDGANHKGTCECGAEIKETHVLSELKKESDGDKYYQECTVEGCNYKVTFDVGDVHVHKFTELRFDAVSHWYKCAECDALSNVTSHSGGEWVTDGSGHHKECETCHQNYNSGNHILSYKDNSNGKHYQQCEICSHTTEEQAHVVTIVKKVNDTNHEGRCNDCGATVTTAHTPNGDFKSESNHNLDGHWLTCTECNSRYNEATHEWSGSWTPAESDHTKTCGDCGQVKREAHSVTSWSKDDNVNHKGNCDGCGKEIKEAHVLSELKKDVDGSKYYQECTVAGCIHRVDFNDVGDVHVHTYKWQHDDFSHWRECTDATCKALEDDPKPHDFSNGWGVSDGKHTHTCKEDNCGYTLTEAHNLISFSGKTASCTEYGQQPYWYCKVCEKYFSDADGKQLINKDIEQWLDNVGEGKIDKIAHSYNGNWLSNESGHWKECTVCGNKQSDPVTHSYGSWIEYDNCQHYKECSACNYRTYADHSYGSNWTVSAGNHSRKCDSCTHNDEQLHDNGLAKNRTAQQNPVGDTPGVRAYSRCSICDTYFDNSGNLIGNGVSALESWKEGAGKINPGEEIAPHEHVYNKTNQHDGVSHWDECECGARENVTAHQVAVGGWTPTNATTHTGSCAVCGETVTKAHTLNKDNECEECGFVLTTASDCKHVVTSGTSNGNETHSGVCEVCGLTVSVAHEFGDDYVTDENGHWHECSVCGAKTDEAEHTVSEWTTDGEHSHSGDCEVCGEHLDVEHKWLFGRCLGCDDRLVEYSEGDIGLAAVAIVAQLFGLIAVAAIISRRMKR